MARPGISSTTSWYFVKGTGATINLDSDPDGLAGVARGDIAEVDIILD